MLWIVLPLIAAAGGMIHTITGFGAGVVMMLVLPYFLDMAVAPALSSSINLFLSLALAFKFRRHIDLRLIIAPVIPYLIGSTGVILAVNSFDTKLLAVAFGFFLILLAAYFWFFSKFVSVTPSLKSAILCGGVSGVCAGLFGIGGPLMALYFLAITDSKASYTGNLQCFFTCTCLCNTLTRVFRGIYTLDLIPLTLLGLIAVNLGKVIGLRLLNRMDAVLIRKIVYLFVGVSGVITVVQNLF